MISQELKKPQFRWIGLLLLALLGIAVLWFLSSGHRAGEVKPAAAAASARGSIKVFPLDQGFVVRAPLRAKDLGSAEARQLVVLGLRAYVNSRHSKLVMTSHDANSGQYASFTVVHAVSDIRGDLYRCDTINFDATTMKPIHSRGRVEITNERGNWELREEPGGETKAFLLQSGPSPVDTVGLVDEFGKAAERMDTNQDNFEYVATDATDNGKPVISIAEVASPSDTTPRVIYTVDATSGAVTSMVAPADGIRRYLDASADIDESDFDVPSSRTVVPVADGMAVQKYLEEHK